LCGEGAIEQTKALLGGAGFAQLGKYSRDAVVVRVSVDGGHGVDGEGNVKSQLVRLAGGRLDTEAGGDAGDNDVRDTQLVQMIFEACVRERSPGPLRHRVVSGLLVQFGDKVGPSGQALSTASHLFRSAWSCAPHVHENGR
jgi:hypothetical protein